MSIARQFFREMRPLFRMLEEPWTRPPAYYNAPRLNRQLDPFQELLARPAMDIRDQGDTYVLDADLPGVKKDNVEVRIGDNGRSITIEGKVQESSGQAAQPNAGAEPQTDATTDSTAVTKADDSATQISSERQFTRNVSFTRTVWLPRPVDTSNVSAKLKDGVLTVTVKKVADKESTVIAVDDQ